MWSLVVRLRMRGRPYDHSDEEREVIIAVEAPRSATRTRATALTASNISCKSILEWNGNDVKDAADKRNVTHTREERADQDQNELNKKQIAAQSYRQ